MLELLNSGMIELDQRFRITKFSKEAVRMTGYTESEVIGKEWHALFEIQHREDSCPLLKTINEDKVIINSIIEIKTKSGLRRPFFVNSFPNPNGTALLVIDLSQIYRLEHELLKEKSELQAILNSIADGVFTIDANWRITNFNPSAARITGYKPEEAIGRPCHTIFQSTVCEKGCPLRRTIETSEYVINFEMEIINKRGKIVPVSVSTALLIDDEGEVIGGVETFRDLSTLRRLSEALKERYSFGNLIGKNSKMQEVYDLIKMVSPTESTVLIHGETGTGKDLVARAIHYNSQRKDGPFVKVSCAAIPENLLESEIFGYKKGAFTGAIRDKPGRFELAEGGTIFLDEVGDIPVSIQVKLLRMIEEQEFEPLGGTRTKKVDVRIIGATNRNLLEMIKAGTFREDLYYRLNVVAINLPPLRERNGDIPLLVDHFIAHFNKKMGKRITKISQEAVDFLIDYPWPGNVRQLEHAIEHAFIHCRGSTIRPEHLPEEFEKVIKPFPLEKAKPLAEIEKEMVIQTLERFNGNRKKTAQALGISRITLWRRIKEYNIEEK